MKQLIYNLLNGWLSDNCDRHYREHQIEGYYEVCHRPLCRLANWIELHLMPDWWYET